MFFFTLGFLNHLYILILFIKTGNKLYLLFQLLWVVLSITAAGYVFEFYILQLFPKLTELTFLNISLAGTSWLISLVPYFFYSLLNLKNKLPVRILLNLSLILFAAAFLPLSLNMHLLYRNVIMICLLLSQLFTIILIWRKKQSLGKYSRKAGIVIIAYLIFLPFLAAVDFFHIHSIFLPSFSDFRFYPLFYFAAALCFVVFTSHRITEKTTDKKERPDLLIEKFGLSRKENEVALLLIKGSTYKEIAEIMFISVNTVNTHVKNIYRKTDCHNKAELSHLALS